MHSSAVWWSSGKLCTLVPHSFHTVAKRHGRCHSNQVNHRAFTGGKFLGLLETKGGSGHSCRRISWRMGERTSVELSPVVERSDGLLEPSATAPGDGRVKKKVCFWVGYVGTVYKGLQLQRSTGVPTVEAELEKAILAAHGMLASNFGNLHRLGWARSSRTDKGVHSISTVISMKMEVPEAAWVHDRDGLALAESINAHLPANIRVFSVVPVPRSFDSRKMCLTRTYEYLLPAAVLDINHSGSVAAREDRVTELNTILSGFQGRHPFHNYTARSKYKDVNKPAYLSRRGNRSSNEESAVMPDVLNDSDPNGVSIPEDELSSFDEESQVPGGAEEDESIGRARWLFEPDSKDKVRTAHFRHIISCSCSPHIETCGNVRLLKLSITGESFMLHQIRKMVGTAVAVLWGVLPPDVIPLSLARHSRIILPLAPSEGLVLVDSVFQNFRQPSSYAQNLMATMNDAKHSRLEPSSEVKNIMQTFLQTVVLPSVAPLLDHTTPVWSFWIDNVTSQAQIEDAELNPVREAFRHWSEQNALQKDLRKQQLQPEEIIL